jgi:hypothetical protein
MLMLSLADAAVHFCCASWAFFSSAIKNGIVCVLRGARGMCAHVEEYLQMCAAQALFLPCILRELLAREHQRYRLAAVTRTTHCVSTQPWSHLTLFLMARVVSLRPPLVPATQDILGTQISPMVTRRKSQRG